ncbi:MAG: hypothetical protein FJX77_05370 [Armatimonadetes bacterium]|nr:hypothetical protein [Armatimonadota bacterium]
MAVNPEAPAAAPNANRVLRGGSYGTLPPLLRVSARYFGGPDAVAPTVGFRVVRVDRVARP